MNFTPCACSSMIVRIWSSWAEPVPPIFIVPFFSLTAAMYSFAVLYGVSALTQRMNWSRARRVTGVRSFQENGTPVWSGVVTRYERVMMMVCASPFWPFTCRKPSARAPPDLLTTMIGRGESLCFSAMPWMSRAIWSAPPPVPAGTTNSMGLVGSHAEAGVVRSVPVSSTTSETDVGVLIIGASPLRARDGSAGRDGWDAVRRAECKTGPDARRRPAPLYTTDRLVTDHRSYFTFNAACAASSFRNGTTPGISHWSHCWSTFSWK